MAYLAKNFPKLCAELGAAVFYRAYRCKAVHEFSLGAGFAIGRDAHLNGSYAASLPSKAGDLMTLNIDRLVGDFLAHVEQRRDEEKRNGGVAK